VTHIPNVLRFWVGMWRALARCGWRCVASLSCSLRVLARCFS